MIARISDAVIAVLVMFVLPVVLSVMTVGYLSSKRAENIACELNRAAYIKGEINEDMITAAAGLMPSFFGGFCFELEAERVIYLPDGVFYETVTDSEIRGCMSARGRYLIEQGDIFRVRVRSGPGKRETI